MLVLLSGPKVLSLSVTSMSLSPYPGVGFGAKLQLVVVSVFPCFKILSLILSSSERPTL